jgi:hypothetical protein
MSSRSAQLVAVQELARSATIHALRGENANIIAIVCLGLFTWAEPASAQSLYSLKVSRHLNVVALSEHEVDNILDDASKILQNSACNVTFKRDGSIGTFGSADTPKIITTRAQRDAVHSVDADVKVVEKIEFCRPGLGNNFDGCAWPPRAGSRSIIVVRHPVDPFPSILWPHELGHRMGLRHRSEPLALMTGCGFDGRQVQVSRNECNCFRSGPGSCRRRDPPRQCDQ